LDFVKIVITLLLLLQGILLGCTCEGFPFYILIPTIAEITIIYSSSSALWLACNLRNIFYKETNELKDEEEINSKKN